MLDEQFWDEYTDRQAFLDTHDTLMAILGPQAAEIQSVLEVGCNRGDNLVALPVDWDVEGVEPNEKARGQAQARGFVVADATADDLPYPDGWADLVFTAGVLIHVPPQRLDRSLREIHRVSGRFVLAIEYFAPEATPVAYRGIQEGIWKRNYQVEYQSRFPGLALVASGLESDLEGTPFEGSSWWLWRK